MLITIADKLAILRSEIRSLEAEIRRVRQYAEQTDRLHHEAICRLHSLLGGPDSWPPKP